MPGMDSMISARSSVRKVSRISRSSSLIRSPRARSWWARSLTSLAARFSPGSAICWDWAASIALAATVSAPRTLRRFQPGCQSLGSDPAKGGRGLVLGQHDDRALGRGVVEGTLQFWADAHEQVAKPVDQLHPVGDQVGPVIGQQPERGDQSRRMRAWSAMTSASVLPSPRRHRACG